MSAHFDAQVPLLVRAPMYPDSRDRRTPLLVELVDLFPTLAELAGVPLTGEDLERIDGVSLAPVRQICRKGSPSSVTVRQFGPLGRSASALACFRSPEGPPSHSAGCRPSGIISTTPTTKVIRDPSLTRIKTDKGTEDKTLAFSQFPHNYDFGCPFFRDGLCYDNGHAAGGPNVGAGAVGRHTSGVTSWQRLPDATLSRFELQWASPTRPFCLACP